MENNALLKKFVPTSEFYSQVIESLQDYAIITVDKELHINSWSFGASKLFGYENEETLGKHIGLIFVDEDKENNVPVIEAAKAIKDGRTDDNRWHLRKDKSRFYAFGLTFPLYSAEGDMLGFVKILRDLTERKTWEETINKYVKELEQLNLHKENILAVLSHDLRSPITAIIMASELLKMNYGHQPVHEAMNIIDQISRISMNQLAMLDNLVKWARVKYASEVFTPGIITIHTVVDKVFETFKEMAHMNRISLQKEIPENTRVYVEERMLISILQNLISNALKHSREGGTVTITSSLQDDMVTITVSDNGIGMTMEEQEKLFTPQVDILSNSTEDNKGGGIGLLLVKGFVEKSGGTIWFKSRKDEGSSFHFTLPLAKS